MKLELVKNIAVQTAKATVCSTAIAAGALGVRESIAVIQHYAHKALSYIPGYTSITNANSYESRDIEVCGFEIFCPNRIPTTPTGTYEITGWEPSPKKGVVKAASHLAIASVMLYAVQKVTAPSFGISLTVRSVQLLNL